ncbi:MAG: GTP-binding protein [Alphaproteobacteria bacterium]|nr:GTP-binding protein [Alphaproteobacteria bacterium]
MLSRRPPPPIPLTVLTGFLGAGKTSLLNRMLKDPALANSLVIINEFGEIGLDHLFVEKVDGDMMLMSSGCLCCTIRGDLVTTLEDAIRRRDNGRMKAFDRVVIETTGLADPAPVLHTIMYHPYLMLRFRLEGVICVVDAVNGSATLDAHQESLRQAAVADRIVLTKTDLISAPSVEHDLRARLNRLNPSALVLDNQKPFDLGTQLLGLGLYDPDGKTPDVKRWLNAEAFAAPAAEPDHHDHSHAHDHAHGHKDEHKHDHSFGHDINRHDDRIRAFCLRSDQRPSPESFQTFLTLLRETNGPSLLRVKGIVALSDDPDRPIVIHGVQHVFHPPVRLDHWPDADHSTRIVFILKDLEPSFVEKFWALFTGAPAIDQADSQALRDNPLKPPTIGGLLG